ncbi:MAG: hypothetical protein LUQ37_08245 [Methanoregulaceae archaeon]|nr:hypothetical protein [Methanoregulaceae archaeon]
MTTRKPNSSKSSPASKPSVEIVSIGELRPDPLNANRHTLAGHRMVEKSMERVKFGRPGLAAADGTVIAGNLSVLEVAGGDLGADEVIIVRTDGSRPVVHVRTDIEAGSPEAIELALTDNRSAEISLDWSPEMIERYRVEHPNIVGGLWDQKAILEVQTADVQIPVTGEEQETWDKKIGYGRILAAHTGIVAGFGRYAALVPADLVDRIIELIKANYGEDADEALPVFLADMLTHYLGGVWPPEKEGNDEKAND